MYRHELSVRRLIQGRRHRAERAARRALQRELSGCVSDADRNELELLAAASRPAGDSVSSILSRQAGVRLYRAG